jgi:2-dehydropantoate 2-reductase
MHLSTLQYSYMSSTNITFLTGGVESTRMRIAVVGAGGVGGALGAALCRADQDVWFLARGPHLVAMQDHGLRITGARGDYALMRVHATHQPRDIGPVSIVLLAVKLWDLEELLPTLWPLIAPGTVVVTLQNGIDAHEHVASTFGAGHVAVGSCFVNAGISEPGIIVQRTETQRIVAGMLTGVRSAALERFGSACRRAEIDFVLTPAPIDMLWEKFVQLVPISAMTALLRRPIGAVRDDEESWTLLLRIMEEAVCVGRATGANIAQETVDRRLAFMRTMPYHAIASMATDLMRGRRLELPWLSGRISELGRLNNIPTPANDFVCVALKPFVGGERMPLIPAGRD